MIENVLLVEDEPLVAMAQEKALTEAGFLVHPATDGASALCVARKVRVSAAVVDIGLQDCSGNDVARELRASDPSLPILICTGHNSTDIVNEIGSIGVRVVEKPIDDALLICALREHIDRSGRSSRASASVVLK